MALDTFKNLCKMLLSLCKKFCDIFKAIGFGGIDTQN